jgi:predicted mannosyl-3-phosphoglycerate phosphatase (HAD superfamily)
VCSNLQHERKIVRDLQQQLDKQHDEMAQELEKGRRQTDALRDANDALTARQAEHDAARATALTSLEAERCALVLRLEASEEQVTRLVKSLAVSLYSLRPHALIA